MPAHTNGDTAHGKNIIGALWMMVAMAAFAVEDAMVKAVAEFIPVG